MIDGFLFINKEQGLTSRKVCNQISLKFGEKKVGHIGTLDPFATGLLIVTLGKGNKAGSFLEKSKKTYIAELKLGIKTSTGDCTSDVISSNAVPELNEDSIKEVLDTFLGKIKQIPPMTSAIHVNGTKLYKLAHKGLEIERSPRDVEIHEIKMLCYKNNIVKFECTVSSGTYIRVLAEDIASKLNTTGHLISLKRTAIGDYSIEDSVSVEDCKNSDVKNIFSVLKNIGKNITVGEDEETKIKNGLIKYIDNTFDGDYLFILNKKDEPIAMYAKIKEGTFEFKRGLF